MKNLAELGDELRARREALGYSRDGVYLKLRIPTETVRALEEGDVRPLPAACYARGFLRSYCALLGLDPGPYVEAYREVLEPAQPARVLALRERPGQPAPPRWAVEGAAWAAVCGLLLAGWLVYAHLTGSPDDPGQGRVDAETLVDIETPPLQEEDLDRRP